MESAFCSTVTPLGFQPNIELVVLDKPPTLERGKYQEFLNELQSYPDVYWKWSLKPGIKEVLVVDRMTNPETRKVHKLRIKRKKGDFIELENRWRFDIKTGRSLDGELKYIFPVEDRQAWAEWEPEFLRQRIERVLPGLRFADLRNYADLLSPGWKFGIYSERFDRVFRRNFNRPAASLSEHEEATMTSCRRFAKEAILGHLPLSIQEFRALVEMMERDAK